MWDWTIGIQGVVNEGGKTLGLLESESEGTS